MTTTTNGTTTGSSATSAVSSSVTQQLLSSLGGGSGIDFNTLADQLSTAEFAARIDQSNTRASKTDTQISSVSTLMNDVSQFASSVSQRIQAGDVSSQPSIANGAVATVSAGTLSGSGSYTLEVSALASAETLTTAPLASATTAVGSGTLTLKFGTTSASGFTADPGQSAVNITIAAGATLTDVAAAINGANAGVSAYVATAADGAHIVLKGKSGANNGFILQASEAPGDPGLAQLAWDPTQGGDPKQLLAQSADAAYKLDGLTMTSPSNTITDAAPGLSLKLTGTNAGAPTTVTFSDPSSAVTTFMTDFTSALNTVVADVNKHLDPQTGDLNQDPGAQSLRDTLAQLANTVIMPNAAAGEPRTLADLGLKLNRDGTYTLDTAQLSATLKASPKGAAAMFTTGLYGVYATIGNISLKQAIASDPSSLAASQARLSTQKASLASDLSDLAAKQATLRQQLVTRFAGVNTLLTSSKSTLSFLQNQVTLWQNKTN